MRTTAELRASSGSEEQGVKVRAKRSRNNLRNLYDDVQCLRRKCDHRR
jgi:hypothetical protein